MAFDASGKVLPNEPDATGVHQRCHINVDYYSAEKVTYAVLDRSIGCASKHDYHPSHASPF
jgi:hypothetical protein